MFTEISISRKQSEMLKLCEDESITEICYGGHAGSGKTAAICIVALINAIKFPGYKAAICRKTLPALKLTTWEEMKNTLVREKLIKKEQGQKQQFDYIMNSNSSEIEFVNGSKFIFLSLELRGDEDLQRLGSTNIDDCFIDESGEIAFEAYSVAKSRVGRGPASILYKRPGKVILSCNPSQNFLRELFYDPYERLGGGEFQKWKSASTYNSKGEKIDAYRCFLRATCYDNPFLSLSYIENLKSLPEKQRRRLYEGDWNYSDDKNSLFTSECISNATIYEIPELKNDKGESIFETFMGIDVSDKGGDKTIVSVIQNNILVEQIDITGEENGVVPIARQLADKVEQIALKYGISKLEARRIGVEKNGVGVGLVSQLQTKGWRITEYIATGKSRSQWLYQEMRDMSDGRLKIFYKIKSYETLRKEMQAHEVNYDGDKPKVLGKDKVREKINHSPDENDSFYIANYVRHQISEYGTHARRYRTVNI
jgi:hypothetical protein